MSGRTILRKLSKLFAAEMRHNMLTYSVWSAIIALIIPKQLRELLVAAGWHKRDIREYITAQSACCGVTGRRVGKANIVHRRGGRRTRIYRVARPR